MKKGRNYRGGGVGGVEGFGYRAQRPDSCSVTNTLGGKKRKKEGHPFKCGAAALIHWVKMGKKGSDRGQIVRSFSFTSIPVDGVPPSSWL